MSKLGFLTTFTTTSDSCDHYSYTLRTEKKPTMKQLERYLKANAGDVDEEGICYECIDDESLCFIDLDNLPEFTDIPSEKDVKGVEFFHNG